MEQSIHEIILGSWKSVENDFIITFKTDNALFINSGALSKKQLHYILVFEKGMVNRWKLTAPEIGINIAFVESVTESELVLNNISTTIDDLVISRDGKFISGFDTIRLHRVG